MKFMQEELYAVKKEKDLYFVLYEIFSEIVFEAIKL
jgi:hypothetical protein